MHASLSGADFKKQLRDGTPKLGLFLNSHSPTVAEQLAHSGYDWLLVDTQHGPMGNESLSGDAGRHRQRRRDVDGARRRLQRPRRHPAVAGHGRRRRAGALHQHRRGGAGRGQLLPLPDRRHALGVLPAAQHEQGRPARLRRRAPTTTSSSRCRWRRPTASRTSTRSPRSPASTCCSSARTTCACRWGSTRGTSSRTCTRHPSSATPPSKLIAAARKHDIILGVFLFGTARVGRVPREGLPVHQRRQRPPSHPHAGRRLREGRRGHRREGGRPGTPAIGADLVGDPRAAGRERRATPDRRRAAG